MKMYQISFHEVFGETIIGPLFELFYSSSLNLFARLALTMTNNVKYAVTTATKSRGIDFQKDFVVLPKGCDGNNGNESDALIADISSQKGYC
jgi:hypothetical protein